MSHKPDGYTIFCDDIRQEIGNKQSLMGIYGHEMFVHHAFPVTMRMGFHVVFREDPSSPLNDITLCIYSPGDPDDNPLTRLQIARSAENTPSTAGKSGAISTAHFRSEHRLGNQSHRSR